MKKLSICLSSIMFLSFIFAESDAFSLFKKKTSDDGDTPPESTSPLVVFGKQDISADIKAADAVKTAFDNARSKFSSADTAIMKYCTDQKVFTENSEVAFLSILSSVIAIEARCFDTISRGFALLKDGMSSIKSSGKNVGGKKEVAGKKAFRQGAKLLEAISIYRVMLNSIMSITIQHAANIKATSDTRKADSKIFKAIHAKDIEKQLRTLDELHSDKKKLIGTQKGMFTALEEYKDLIADLTEVTDPGMSGALDSINKHFEDFTVIEERISKFVGAIGQAIMESKSFKAQVENLADFNRECNEDNAALSEKAKSGAPEAQSKKNSESKVEEGDEDEDEDEE
ncbi:MAG: hypothetical protein LBT70_03530 [Holosporaceae bacterium]|jgi:hypothetical protein|nr:hypothetical protein [Holosporaceae bacterium]